MPDAPIGRGQYELSADRTQLTKDLAAAKGDVTKAISQTEQQANQAGAKLVGLSGTAKAAIVGVGATVGSLGGAAFAMGQQYAAATNVLIEKTGASGDALKGLQDSMGKVASQVPEDMATVAGAVADLNKRLGLTGPALSDASKAALDFARLNKEDVSTAVGQAADAMNRMQIPADQLPALLDKATVAEQKTGISAGDLFTALDKVGPTLQDMGFSVDQSIALLGQWSQMGGNTADLAKGMNKAFQVFAKEGATNAQQAMQMLVDQIKNAPDDMTAASNAAAIFGNKLGTTMAQQIRSGALDINGLTTAVQNSTGALDQTTERTKTWEDRFKEFTNSIAAQVGPITGSIGQIGMGFDGLTKLLVPLGGLAGGIAGKLIAGFKGLAAKVIPTAAVEATAIGAAEGEAESAAATGPSALQSFLAKFGLMTGAKVTAAAAAGTEEGLAEGNAAADAANSEGVLGKFKGAGGAAGGIFGLGIGGGLLVAAGGLASMGPQVFSQMFQEGQIIDSAKAAARQYASGYSQEIQDQMANVVGTTIHNALSSGKSYQDALTAGEQAGKAYLDGVGQPLNSAPEVFAAFTPTVTAAATTVGTAAGTAVATGTLNAFNRKLGANSGNLADAFGPWGAAAGTAFVNSAAAAVATSAAGAFAAIAPGWNAVVKANLEQPFYDLGKGSVSDFTQGLWDDRTTLSQTASKLQDILKNGLSPQKQALEAEGKKYIELVDDGMESKKTGAKETAMQVAAAAIKSIEDTAKNGSPDVKGAKAIGTYLGLLFTGGLKADDVDALLKGQGLSAQAIQGIHDKYPQFFAAGSGAAVQVHTGLTSAGKGGTNPWQGYGYTVAGEWITGFANKFDAYNWANLINHSIGPNFAGQSPPKEGPLHDIDKWGYNVGDAYAGGMFKGIEDGTAKRIGGIGRIPALGTPPGLLQAATVVPAGVTPGGGVTHIHHWHIGTLVADDYGLKKLHSEMERVMTHWER